MASSESFFRRMLPLEIRNLIYECAIEPYAEIWHATLEDLEMDARGHSLPTMTYREEGRNIKGVIDEYEDDSEYDSWDDDEELEKRTDPNKKEEVNIDTPILAFRLSTFTPLLLVCQEVRFEVQKLLEILRPRYFKAIKSSIYLQQVVQPNETFIDICSRSTFHLMPSVPHSIFFINRLRKRFSIHNIIIDGANFVFDILYARDAWKKSNDNKCIFGSILHAMVPKLQELSISIPNGVTSYREYCLDAPELVCGMLERGEVGAIRFFYRNPTDKESAALDEFAGSIGAIRHCAWLERIVGIIEDKAQEPSENVPYHTGPNEVVSRKFDVVEEVQLGNINEPKNRIWKEMNVRRVGNYKMARYEDWSGYC